MFQGQAIKLIKRSAVWKRQDTQVAHLIYCLVDGVTLSLLIFDHLFLALWAGNRVFVLTKTYVVDTQRTVSMRRLF